MTPHDALFKLAFSDVEHAAGELRSALPPALVACIDFATLTKEPGSFVDDTLSSSHADVLFSAQVGGRPALLYLLLEHQSTVDGLMAFGRLVLFSLRSGRRPTQLFRSLGHWSDLFGELTRSPSGVGALAALMRYHHEVSGVTPQRLSGMLEASVGPEVREAMKTTADMLRDEGRVDAQRETVLRLLRVRFGAIDPRHEARIANATGAELEVWLDRILTAKTASEVLGDS